MNPASWAFAVVAALCPVSILHADAEATPAELTARLAAADAAQGQKLFLQCAACHVFRAGDAATIGPNLWNVLGRPVASQPGFDYSDSLKKVGSAWSYATLDRYLLDPRSVAPEGRMLFAGISNAAERAHLIAYLRTLSDTPPALPQAAGKKPQGSSASVTASAEHWQGLPPGPGRDEVFYLCKGCHSLMIVKQQALNRATWDETLRWMVEKQGMPAINDPEIRNRVLDYLSKHFGSK